MYIHLYREGPTLKHGPQENLELENIPDQPVYLQTNSVLRYSTVIFGLMMFLLMLFLMVCVLMIPL
jgi:hypothetical protein